MCDALLKQKVSDNTIISASRRQLASALIATFSAPHLTHIYRLISSHFSIAVLLSSSISNRVLSNYASFSARERCARSARTRQAFSADDTGGKLNSSLVRSLIELIMGEICNGNYDGSYLCDYDGGCLGKTG